MWMLIVVLLSGDSFVLDYNLSYEDCVRAAIKFAPLDVGCQLQDKEY